MAKTFNPNRVGGGTFSIVRAADGTYSLKETGFDQISSLNMIDLGAVTSPPKVLPVEPDDGVDELKDQTKAAFLLPKQDRGDDPFTFEKSLKTGADISKGLQDVETVSDRQKTESQLGETGRNPFRNIDTGVGEFEQTKSPGIQFGRTPLEDDFGFGETMVGPKVETPQEKLKVTSANVQKGLVEPPLKGLLETLKGPMLKRDQTKFTKPSERAALGFPGDKSEVAQAGTIPPDAIVQGQPALGIRVPDAIKTGQPAIAPGVPDAIIQGQPSAPAKKTFIDSASTALKNIGDTATKIAMMSPTLRLIRAAATPVNESVSTTAFNKNRFNVVTSSGSMQGRIVGDDGNYDPANNLFHGMNRSSKFGNLEKAGQKRIDNINKTLARQAKKGKQSQTLIDRRDKFENELDDYRRGKNDHNIKSAKKKGIDTSKLNPNEMRNVAETGDSGGGGSGGKSIVCTAMYQTTGLQDWAKAMKIWYIYQKRYLTIQHQEGYHKLFKPFVKAMHKSNIVKAIGAHFAKHRTQHLKHVLFKSKPSLLGKVYSKILETICYWAGKK